MLTATPRDHLMEQMKGIEPSCRPWQGRVLAVKPHLQIQSNYIKKNKKSKKKVKKTRKKVEKMCENQFEKLESRQEK